MSFLNPAETELVAESIAKSLKRCEIARDKLAQSILTSGAAYGVRWAQDALETEARYRALVEVHSFYDFDTTELGNPELGREQADKRVALRVIEKLRYICNGSSSETEQVRDAQAYAWAKGEFAECIMWAAQEARQAAKALDLAQLKESVAQA